MASDAVARLSADFSVESTPREATRTPSFSELLRPGTSVYVTYLANTPFDLTVNLVRRLSNEGMRPVPHLAARAVRDVGHLDEMLARLTGEGGVEEVLVIAGGVAPPAGSFDASVQVLRTGILEARGIRRVGLAGHPEGNKDIGDQGLRQALAEKNAFAASTDMDLYLVTQFCFAPDPIVAWERRIRQEGNRLPVRIGLPGLASPATLLKFGLSCGVGPSIKVLRKQAGNLLRLATASVYLPDRTMLGVARATVEDPDCLLSSFHFFPFGALARTATWARGIAEGRFAVNASTDRLEVTA